MTLRQTQSKFAVMVANLIIFARDCGYEVTFGDAYRDPRVFGEMGVKQGYGEANSCHKLRLAVDLNLFIDGVYRPDVDAYKILGEFWERQGGSWGGRFAGANAGDANHFSMAWEGHK